jgi:hypothetical protein
MAKRYAKTRKYRRSKKHRHSKKTMRRRNGGGFTVTVTNGYGSTLKVPTKGGGQDGISTTFNIHEIIQPRH